MFNQFEIPHIMCTPTILITMTMILPMIFNPQDRVLMNRPLAMTKWLIKMITNSMTAQLNQNGQKFSLLLSSLMLMLLFFNLTGLLPYTFTATSHLSVNMALAAPLWLSTVLIGVTTKPTMSTGHLLPEGSPMMLAPALIMIETASLLMRPIALGVRLTANITAGHLLIHMISSATLAIANLSLTLSLASTIVLILLTSLEIAVACIQAYVFVLLLSLYLMENT